MEDELLDLIKYCTEIKQDDLRFVKLEQRIKEKKEYLSQLETITQGCFVVGRSNDGELILIKVEEVYNWGRFKGTIVYSEKSRRIGFQTKNWITVNFTKV